jgi:hypothetical protein
MNRVLSVARVHLVPGVVLAWPWAILASSFAVNLIIFGALGDSVGNHTTGGLASIYIVMSIFCAQSVAQMFPYALGMSVSRRTFYLATSLVTIGLSLAYAIVLFGLRQLERATDGWGIHLHFFDLGFLATGDPVTQILAYAAPFLAVGFFGMFFAAVHRRWGSLGVFALLVVGIAGFGGGSALLTLHHNWSSVWAWFERQSTVALLIGWPAAIAVVFALAGWIPMRRATA